MKNNIRSALENDFIFKSIDDITGPVSDNTHDLKNFIFPKYLDQCNNTLPIEKKDKETDLTTDDLNYIEKFINESIDL